MLANILKPRATKFKEKHICQANLILEFLHQRNAVVSSTLLPYFCDDSLAITTKSYAPIS